VDTRVPVKGVPGRKGATKRSGLRRRDVVLDVALDIVEQNGWRSRRSCSRDFGWQAEMVKDPPDDAHLVDDSHQAKATPAPWARQHVKPKAAPHHSRFVALPGKSVAATGS
jgi:hypothetical protein